MADTALSNRKIAYYRGDPWSRQPEETSFQWIAFATYRDLGKTRSLKELAKKLNRKITTIRNYSGLKNWKDRCVAYDSYIDREANKSALQSVIDMRSRHTEVARLGIDLAKIELEKYLRFSHSKEGITIKPKEVTALVESLAKLERLSMGESTENINTHKKVEIDVLCNDELLNLKALLQKAHSGNSVIVQPEGGQMSPSDSILDKPNNHEATPNIRRLPKSTAESIE